MNSYKRDFTKSLAEDIDTYLSGQDSIQTEFKVAPLDQAVLDWNTPTLFISNFQFFFTYDDVIEVYDLNTLEISIYGDTPSFELWRILIEPKFFFDQSQPESLSKMKQSDYLVRFVMNEPNHVTKEFVLRDGINVKKNYQNWAMAQMIVNLKNGGYDDPELEEIVDGQLLVFDQKVITMVIFALPVYIIVRMLFISLLPSLLSFIIDLLFGIMLIALLVWTYKSFDRNFKRYKSAYLKYYR